MIGLAILMLVPLAIAAAIYSVLAVWAALGRGHWFLRGAVVCGTLALLLPIHAYEPLAIFMVATPLILIASLVIRRILGTSSDEITDGGEAPGRWGRFHLLHVFFAMMLVGAYCAYFASLLGRELAFDSQQSIYAGVCVAAIASFALLLLASRGLWRLLAAAELLAAICGTALLFAHFLQYWYGTGYLGVLRYSTDLTNNVVIHFAIFFTLVAIAEIVVFATLMATGQLGGFPLAIPIAPRARRWAAALLAIPALGILVTLAVIYVLMARGREFPGTPYGATSSYAEVCEAAAKLHAINPSEQTLDQLKQSAGLVAVREADELQALLIAMVSTPGHVPFDPEKDGDIAYNHWPQEVINLRGVARMWTAESQAAAAAGRVEDATRFNMSTVRLGDMLAHGGVMTHTLVGFAIENMGIHEQIRIRDQLPIPVARESVRELYELDRDRESADVLIARELAWHESIYYWLPRYRRAFEEITGTNTWPIVFLAAVQPNVQRRDAFARLLMLDLAIRLYEHDHAQLPSTLDALVPEYLPKLPLDPYTQEDFVYRPQGATFELYSVGQDGDDDGGQFGASQDVWNWERTDLDFDLESISRRPAP